MIRVYSVHLFGNKNGERIINVYNFGVQTGESAEIVLRLIGEDIEEMRTANASDRFDYALYVAPRVQAWFKTMFTDITVMMAVRFVADALGVEITLSERIEDGEK